MISKMMLCAKGVLIDRTTNNVSVFEILERIGAPGFPLIMSEITIYNLLERKESESNQANCELKMSIDGLDIPPITDIVVDFLGNQRNRLTLNLQGLNVPKPGTLKFTLFCNGKALDSCELSFVQVGQPLAPKVEVKTS